MAMRTFLALDLDEDIRRHMAEVAAEIRDSVSKVRGVEASQLHVTLKFLGDVPDEQIGSVCAIVSEAAAGVAPFDFDVRGVLPVPPQGRQLRMFWAGIEDASSGMASLHGLLDAGLAGMGFKEEDRRFQPHVTLARVKFTRDAEALRRLAEPHRAEDFGRQHAAEVVVYSSQLTPDGPVYTPLSKAPLGA